MDIKMIAVDLDGTLFRDDKTVSDRTITALKKCRDKGIKVIYATARGNSAEQLVPGYLFDGCIRMNGAVAYADGLQVYSKRISTSEVKNLLLAADNAGIRFSAELGGSHYTNFAFPEDWGLDFNTRYEISDFNTLDIEVEKIWALPETEAEIEVLKKHMQKGHYIITARDDNFTMIMHEDAKKANAVDALANHWNISSSDIAAFGDDLIDISMLEFCGVGIAMGNAIDEVKSVADYICDTNENDGIAKWLEEYII